MDGRDVTLIQQLLSAYDAASKSAPELSLPHLNDVVAYDQQWVDATSSRNGAERTKLEVELKTYTSNSIRESIRVCSKVNILLCEITS